MSPKTKPFGLYAITPEHLSDAALISACAEVIAGGAVCLQYRAKEKPQAQREREAAALQVLCAQAEAEFIINDDLALALKLRCGVHLGEHDGSVKTAREALGPKAFIGVSCYDSFALAKHAAANGASYLAFGAFYPSSTKSKTRKASLDLLRQAAVFALPRVAIGGITPENAAPVIAAGADYLAVVNALFEHPEQVRSQAERFSACFAGRAEQQRSD